MSSSRRWWKIKLTGLGVGFIVHSFSISELISSLVACGAMTPAPVPSQRSRMRLLMPPRSPAAAEHMTVPLFPWDAALIVMPTPAPSRESLGTPHIIPGIDIGPGVAEARKARLSTLLGGIIVDGGEAEKPHAPQEVRQRRREHRATNAPAMGV